MKTILLILICLIVSPISVGSSSSTIRHATFVEDDAMEKVVYKLNSLETSLNTLNENLIKLDSLR